MTATTIVAVLTGVVGGALVTGWFNIATERDRRKHDLAVRSGERDAERAASIQARQVDTYERAITRLRGAHAALDCAVGTMERVEPNRSTSAEQPTEVAALLSYGGSLMNTAVTGMPEDRNCCRTGDKS